jgi:hypothetical protein
MYPEFIFNFFLHSTSNAQVAHKSTTGCTLLIGPPLPTNINFKTSAQTQSYQRYQIFFKLQPFKYKIQHNLKLSSNTQLCPLSHSQRAHFPTRYLLYFPLLQIPYSLPLSEGQAGTAREPSNRRIFCSIPHTIPIHSSLCSSSDLLI